MTLVLRGEGRGWEPRRAGKKDASNSGAPAGMLVFTYLAVKAAAAASSRVGVGDIVGKML